MHEHKIIGKAYYLATDLLIQDPLFFKKCYKRVRDIMNGYLLMDYLEIKINYLFLNNGQ